MHNTEHNTEHKTAQFGSMHPSAFAATEIQLSDFVDLEQFPIHDLTSPAQENLVVSCRQELLAYGCAHAPQFINARAITLKPSMAELWTFITSEI